MLFYGHTPPACSRIPRGARSCSPGSEPGRHPAAAVELALCDGTGAPAVRIRYDGRTLDANGTVLPRVLTDDPRRFKLHLFYDKSVMELFINDGLQTVIRVAIPPSAVLHLEAGLTGGTATLQRLTVWPIKGYMQ